MTVKVEDFHQAPEEIKEAFKHTGPPPDKWADVVQQPEKWRDVYKWYWEKSGRTEQRTTSPWFAFSSGTTRRGPALIPAKSASTARTRATRSTRLGPVQGLRNRHRADAEMEGRRI
jgi:hypothetical protein